MSFTYLTIAIPFHDQNTDQVDKVLEELGAQTRHRGKVRDAFRGRGVHFLSMTTVPASGGSSAFLIIESSHDGELGNAIRTVAQGIGNCILDTLAAAQVETPIDLEQFLSLHAIQTGTGLKAVPGLNHRGAPGMTVDRIFREEAFADRLREMVSSDRTNSSSLTRLRRLRERIGTETEFENMMDLPKDLVLMEAAPTNSGLMWIISLVFRGVTAFFWPFILIAAAVFLAALLWLGIGAALWTAVISLLTFVGLLAGIYAALRRAEVQEVTKNKLPEPDLLGRVMEVEDDGVVNHLAGISVMKPGRLRRFTLKIAFWIIGQLATHQFRPGFLSEIGTIHSARWVLVPGTDKLLFFSNYSGSWESYLEDFVSKASNGLTGVWSNTKGFPQAKNLFWEGATDGDRFKRWARCQQRPSYFWYRAYPNKSVHQVRLNAAIRQGVLTAETEDMARDWYSLFGSRQRAAGSLEVDEIQKIVFGGMKSLRDGVLLAIELPSDREAAQSWLRTVEPFISFGDESPQDVARMIALAASGLEKLSLTGEEISRFPIAFQQGMDAPKRADRVLMDTGEDAPEHWEWGNSGKKTDLVLSIVARAGSSTNEAAKDAANFVEELKRLGGRIVAKIETTQLPESGPVREHFGFVDGVSQPILRGSRRWARDKSSLDIVAPGEFVLGYPDNRDYLPTAISVAASRDPQNILPAETHMRSGHAWPDFNSNHAGLPRDFSRNGSFLVVRQLEQHVSRFRDQSLKQAKRIADHPSMPADLSLEQRAVWIQAKAVGRWPDGSSLTRHPHAPASGWSVDSVAVADNDFLHGQEDPEGRRCPFSAHIRRTNPRDSFDPGSMKQLDIVNRHRILRIGRPYGPSQPTKGKPQGLMFMCLNGDLERQFEFVQQTWAMSRHFHGLTDEVDAIIGRGGKGGRLTVPTEDGPINIDGFQDVVSTRGGGYFFMPSRSALRFLMHHHT